MSGYEKLQDSFVYGYTSTRQGQEQSYAGPIQPSFDSQYSATQADEPHALVGTHQMPYLGPSFEPRDTSYQSNPASVANTSPRSPPDIISTGPFSGRTGEIFRLDIRSKIDYITRPYSFAILFGNTGTTATLLKQNFSDSFYHYALQTIVPPDANPEQAQQTTMPLLLDVREENGQTMSMRSLGNFTYLDSPSFPRFAAPLEVQKKRKYAEDTPDFSQLPAKRSASTPLHSRVQGTFPPVSETGLHAYDSGGLYAMPSVYERPVPHQRAYIPPITQRMSHVYPGSPPMTDIVKGRSPSLSGFTTYASAGRQGPSPRMSVAPQVVRPQTKKSGASSPNPPLIRTSILQPQVSSSFRTPGFNPYTIYPAAKAKLEIQGDLLTMATVPAWTDEEKKAKRRLVEFQRRQEDSIIHASFKPVTVEERTQGANCVSCIYWEERGECFVTSVDTIQLLEGLVAVRFTVEEKNRIRRNLEGFKPLTVSKQKEDSETFFRLIMGFPNPKPRNIEKDVKVFPWSILSGALKKIIGKYSASYASTSAILTPSTSSGYVTSIPEPTLEHLPTASPRSTTSSAGSHGYPAPVTTTALPSGQSGRGSIDGSANPYNPMRHTSQPVSSMSHWSSTYPSAASTSHYAIGHGSHSSRSWGIAAFGDEQLSDVPPHQIQYFPGTTSAEHHHSAEYPTNSQAHG